MSSRWMCPPGLCPWSGVCLYHCFGGGSDCEPWRWVGWWSSHRCRLLVEVSVVLCRLCEGRILTDPTTISFWLTQQQSILFISLLVGLSRCFTVPSSILSYSSSVWRGVITVVQFRLKGFLFHNVWQQEGKCCRGSSRLGDRAGESRCECSSVLQC